MENWLKRKLPGETSVNYHGGSVAESVALKCDKSAKLSKKTSSGTITTVPSTQLVHEMTTLLPNSTHLILPKRKIEVKGPSSNKILNISSAPTGTSNLSSSKLSGRISSVTGSKGIDEQHILPGTISLRSIRQVKKTKMSVSNVAPSLMKSIDSGAMLKVNHNSIAEIDALREQNRKLLLPTKDWELSTITSVVDASGNAMKDKAEIPKSVSVGTQGTVISPTDDSDQIDAAVHLEETGYNSDDYQISHSIYGHIRVADMALSGSSDDDQSNEDEDENGDKGEDGDNLHDENENENDIDNKEEMRTEKENHFTRNRGDTKTDRRVDEESTAQDTTPKENSLSIENKGRAIPHHPRDGEDGEKSLLEREDSLLAGGAKDDMEIVVHDTDVTPSAQEEEKEEEEEEEEGEGEGEGDVVIIRGVKEYSADRLISGKVMCVNRDMLKIRNEREAVRGKDREENMIEVKGIEKEGEKDEEEIEKGLDGGDNGDGGDVCVIIDPTHDPALPVTGILGKKPIGVLNLLKELSAIRQQTLDDFIVAGGEKKKGAMISRMSLALPFIRDPKFLHNPANLLHRILRAVRIF